jgi:hypothetical protein
MIVRSKRRRTAWHQTLTLAVFILVCGGCASVRPEPTVPYGAEEKQTGILTLSDEWADVLACMGPLFYVAGELLGCHN